MMDVGGKGTKHWSLGTVVSIEDGRRVWHWRRPRLGGTVAGSKSVSQREKRVHEERAL